MKRNYTREFKLECCRPVATGQKRPAQRYAASKPLRERACSSDGARSTRQEAKRPSQKKQPTSREAALEARIAELERVCGKLALENEIQKWGSRVSPQQRHTMISEAKEAHETAIAERELSRLFGVSRSRYYERPTPEKKAARDLELRDAIERIVLEFPFSTVFVESPRNSTGVDGRSTTSES